MSFSFRSFHYAMLLWALPTQCHSGVSPRLEGEEGRVVEVVVQFSKQLLRCFGSVPHMHDSKVNPELWRFMHRLWGSPPADCSLGPAHCLAHKSSVSWFSVQKDGLLWVSAAWATTAQHSSVTGANLRSKLQQTSFKRRGGEKLAPIQSPPQVLTPLPSPPAFVYFS